MKKGPAARISALIDKKTSAMWTLIPAVVVSVNRQTMRADVRIKTFGQTEFPIVEDLPIVFPKGGSSIIMMPLQVGDVVLCGFSKYAMDSVLIDDTVRHDTDVGLKPKFQMKDAFILGGFATDAEIAANSWELPSGDIIIHDPDVINLGDLIKIADRGSTPSTPENGMIWRDGTTIWGHSGGFTTEWGGVAPGAGYWQRVGSQIMPTNDGDRVTMYESDGVTIVMDVIPSTNDIQMGVSGTSVDITEYGNRLVNRIKEM